VLSAYSSGDVDWRTAAEKLGLQDHGQLAIAMADAGLDLPGTDEETIAAQAKGADELLRPWLITKP
jgi:hypothetical protein